MSKATLSHSKRRNLHSAFYLILLTFLTLTASAAAPANDLCSGAVVIPSGGTFPYLTPAIEITDATTTGDPSVLPDCQTNVIRSIWYRFTPTNSEFYTFSTCPSETTVGDTVLAIYTNALGCSSPTTFSNVACADDSSGGCGTKAVLTAPLTANTTYYIIAWQYSKSTIISGEAYIRLAVSKTPPPSNDTCQNAQPLGLNMSSYGSTLAANNNYETDLGVYSGLNQMGSTAGGRDVVFTFIAPATDTYSVRVSDYSSDPNDLVIYATSYCPGTGPAYTYDSVLAAANRTAGLGASTEELFCMLLEQDQQIYIVVDEDFLINNENMVSPGSTFRIEVNQCRVEQEGNDSPETASALPCGVEGSLGGSYDSDYYALGSYPAGSRVFALVDSSATTPTGCALQVRTNTSAPTEILQFASANNPDIYGANAANLGGTILPEGPAFLRAYDPARRAKEPYRLYAVVQPPMSLANAESEPNNTYETANAAMNDYNYFRGSISNSVDVDVFRFTAMGGDLIFASLDCDPLRNATPFMGRLELLDADGKSLLSVDTRNSGTYTNNSDVSPASLSIAFIHRVADEGEFFVRVSVSPDAGPYNSGDYLLSVSKNCYAGSSGNNTAPVLTNLNFDLAPIIEGDMATLGGHVIDPDTGESFTVLVDWGDGSEPETINPGAGVYDLAIPHVYVDNGSYPLSLTLSDNSGASFATNRVVVVSNGAPSLTALLVTPDSIFENNSVTLDGSLSDPGVLDTHTVVINWGDGSANTTLNLTAEEMVFSADHLYLDDNPTGSDWDACSISVTVTDNNGGSCLGSVPVLVSNLPPVLASATLLPATIVPNQSATLSASFADTGTRDTFTYSVNWGDGSTDTRTAVSPLNLSHVYALSNTNLTVSLTIQDDDGGSVSTNLPIHIQMPSQPQLSLSVSNSWYWVQVLGSPNITYRLQVSTNLPAWSDLSSLTLNSNGVAGVKVTNTLAAPPRFFRAIFQ